jgi:hypothetical protein
MEISIYSSDVRDFDEQVESFFDIRHRWGSDLFDENDRLTLKNYDYALEPYTYIAIMCDMQEQINELVAEVKELRQDGWSRK